MRTSKRFPLTGVGDLNTFALFAELGTQLISSSGRLGIVVPTSIATDDNCKDFFGNVTANQRLSLLYDFENREGLFQGVHRAYKFSLLVLGGSPIPVATFGFFLTNTLEILDERRRFQLRPADLETLNPNTRTSPVFRTRVDAMLTQKVYSRLPILIRAKGENTWNVSYLRMFDMANDSSLFSSERGNDRLPLYEGKMLQAYDHRAASVVTNSKNLKRPGQPVETTLREHEDPDFVPQPQYWVAKDAVAGALPAGYTREWLLAFKRITSATNERTFIATLLPLVATSDSLFLFMQSTYSPALVSCFLANLNALPFDYLAKQKVGGVNLSYFIVNQLPVVPPHSFCSADVAWVSTRVLELVYTSRDLCCFAKDMGYNGPAFRWDEDRRETLKAELDAYFAHLYGLTRLELRYMLDPKDIFGGDFPSETFRVLKEHEQKHLGEYRTRRLVLDAFDNLAETDRFRREMASRKSAFEVPSSKSLVAVQ
jgi:hypothetical protein